jgi:hypothetical protein
VRPVDVDPHGLAGVAVLLRRAAAAAGVRRLVAADAGADGMPRALEDAARRVDDALHERALGVLEDRREAWRSPGEEEGCAA